MEATSSPRGTLPSDPAACAAMTQTTYTAPTGLTDPPTKAEAEAEFGKIKADLDEIKVDTAALKTAIDANNAAIDKLIDVLSQRGY